MHRFTGDPIAKAAKMPGRQGMPFMNCVLSDATPVNYFSWRLRIFQSSG